MAKILGVCGASVACYVERYYTPKNMYPDQFEGADHDSGVQDGWELVEEAFIWISNSGGLVRSRVY